MREGEALALKLWHTSYVLQVCNPMYYVSHNLIKLAHQQRENQRSTCVTFEGNISVKILLRGFYSGCNERFIQLAEESSLPAFQAIGSVVHVSTRFINIINIAIVISTIINIVVAVIITIAGIWFNLYDAGIVFSCSAFIFSG